MGAEAKRRTGALRLWLWLCFWLGWRLRWLLCFRSQSIPFSVTLNYSIICVSFSYIYVCSILILNSTPSTRYSPCGGIGAVVCVAGEATYRNRCKDDGQIKVNECDSCAVCVVLINLCVKKKKMKVKMNLRMMI
jgi:hypothetical protein